MIDVVKNNLRKKTALWSAGLLALANLVPAKAATEATVNGITYKIPDAVGAAPRVLDIGTSGSNAIKIYFNVNQINQHYALIVTKDPFGPDPKITKVVQYTELAQQSTGGEYLYDTSRDQSGLLYTFSFGPSSTTVSSPVASAVRLQALKSANSGFLEASLTPVTPLNSTLPSYVTIEVVGDVTQFGSTPSIKVPVIDGKINFAAKSPNTFVQVISATE